MDPHHIYPWGFVFEAYSKFERFFGISVHGFAVGKYCNLKQRFPIVGHIPLPGFNGHSNGMLKSILGDGIRAFVFPPIFQI